MNIDLEELAAVVRLLKEADFSEFSYSKGDVAVLVRRGELTDERGLVPPPHAKPVSTPTVAPSSTAPIGPVSVASVPVSATAEVEGKTIPAPLLGTFYSAPKPGEPPFVKIGDQVEIDTVVCVVEVMKLMNSVTAEATGIIAAVHATDGELVEHGQPLFTIAEVS